VLYVVDVMAEYFAYVQLPIQSVRVDQSLGTKHVRLPSYITSKTAALCVTRESSALCYT
jgi:DNA integrity scanning protein DisA with diadenylate cyclase activity